MKELRLLERIAGLGLTTQRSHITRVELLIESIMTHLSRILNTRQGSVPIDLSFGVPDFTNLAGSFAVGTTTQMIEDMNRMIQRYEPRLRKPQIAFSDSQDDVLSLAFSITGFIAVDNREIPIRLISHVAANGRVSLGRP